MNRSDAMLPIASLLLSAVLGCGSTQPTSGNEEQPTSWIDGYAVPDQAERRASLRDGHSAFVGAEDEGRRCVSDSDCNIPLRCFEAKCDWPPAMTGYADAYTPVAVVETSRGTKRFFLELVRSERERATGLMSRRQMQPEFGMLFLFEEERMQSFWMRNTLISLDMIFIRADGVVDSIVENAEPLTETARSSAGPAKYVLELEGGAARFHGIEPGSKFAFVNVD